MAIKGKGRTRTRQSIRAPRREPVPVPVPFALRKGVQLAAAFIAGLLVFCGGVWLTNGLRAERASEQERAAALTRRQAGAAWNDVIQTEVGSIGSVQAGQPPVILPTVGTTIRELKKGDPANAAKELQDAADEAERVSTAIEEFDLVGTIRNKGFDAATVLQFLSARDDLVMAIDLYREAALLGVVAADVDGGVRKDLLGRAESLLGDADTGLTRFFEHQTEAMAAAGVVQQPTFPGS